MKRVQIPTDSSAVRVVVADDHAIIQDAVRSLLVQAGAQLLMRFEICAIAPDGLAAIAQVKAHRPDLLFLDISMPLASGAEIIHDIRRWSPATRIVVFTGITSPGLVASTVEAGVDGLFSKGGATTAMIDKLPLILRGGRFIAPEFEAMIAAGRQAATLTDRERQILNMVVAGKTNKEMAQMLNISPKTVDKHRSSLMTKLDVHSAAQLMMRALKDGLIDPT
ncbi:LuxR C-terminal-related transcriptional regulator [Denitromonas halophila]|uniref:Response regulator transcription factor n=1 Tax=Denitromonas halophila TaxID=1629404 RepID=A0A557R134_9RHOO|nr:response regulator transcription factor [Denitromonas halophila]TVO58844.1 response regulator transcription factor [Denitromonas halophila]